jgi:YVTN family beta-propeller protein
MNLKNIFTFFSATVLFSLTFSQAFAQDSGSLVAELHSNKCVDIRGASMNDGGEAIQFNCGSNANQQFNFVRVNDLFQIQSVNSGKCLGVQNASLAAGANIVQLTCENKPHLLWKIEGEGAERQLRLNHSNMCMNVKDGSLLDQTPIIQWPCENGNNSKWRIDAVIDDPKNPIATLKSRWDGPYNLPLVAASAAQLPDGRILTWSAFTKMNFAGGFNKTYSSIFDVEKLTATDTLISNTGHDMFCPGTTMLPDGKLMVTGGNNSQATSVYNPSNNSWTKGDLMQIKRGYHAMTLLGDGSIFTVGGSWSGGRGGKDAELWTADVGWQKKPNILADDLKTDDAAGIYRADNHMWLFPAPNGKIFHAGPAKQMNWLNTTGNGKVIRSELRGDDSDAMSGTAVMYDIGKILTIGGSKNYDNVFGTRNAFDIDINGGEGNEKVTKLKGLLYQRVYHNSVVLPSGEVVVVGGQKYSRAFSDNLSIFAAEIWNPETKLFSRLANMKVPRNYHSVALLLKDGRVFVSGSGLCGTCTTNHPDVEILTPPYLLNDDGTLATRPVIRNAPVSAKAGDTIQVTMNTNGAHKFALMRLGAVTHTVNNDQRRVPLEITNSSGNQFSLKLPANTSVLLPGNYFLFALNQQGVPSVAQTINIALTKGSGGIDDVVDPNHGTLSNIPTITAGGTATFQTIVANGYTYSWNFGDGSPDTPYSTAATVSHNYKNAGVYQVTLSTKDSKGLVTRKTYLQAVATTKTSNSPNSSTPVALELQKNRPNRIWTVNPDNNSVSVIDTTLKTVVATINVGLSPRSVAIAPNGNIWVTNKKSATISVISPISLTVTQTINLPRASQPHGLVFSPVGANAYVALEAKGELIKLNAANGSQLGVLAVGQHPRHLSITADGSKVLVSRFITPPLPGESTKVVNVTKASNVGAQVLVINTANMRLTDTILLKHSDKSDSAIQGAGIPNYLSAAAISPDGTNAWVPSKQDNIKRGLARNGVNLDFQNTVRAISSRINLGSMLEEHEKRVDHDNASVASAAVYHPNGVYLFVALETSRQVAVVDAISGTELSRIEVGRAPQGLVLSADGNTLFVQEFMDRSVSMVDISPILKQGVLRSTISKVITTVNPAQELLAARVVLGKQLFYDAKDPRLSKDSYMSCATCHNDGGHDGRVWDLTGFGEGLRNTIALNGRAGMGHGFLHWSGNFDEVQDFEKQIRDLSGGLGLMTDAQYNRGTRNQALGDRKSGVSTNLDELASYVASLNNFAASPYRNNDGTLSANAVAGKTIFNAQCTSCHGGVNFSISNTRINNLRDIGSINSLSGKRLNGDLTRLDVPTLRDVWSTAPYLHNGSAATLASAITAHKNITLKTADVNNVVAYLEQIGDENIESSAPPANATNCAIERTTCTLPTGATATVWYGANNTWTSRQDMTGSFACDNLMFGDPLFGVVKSCRYVINPK